MADSNDAPATIRTVIALTAAMAAAPLAARAEEPVPPAPVRVPDEQARPLVLEPGPVQGTVVDLDGKTPLEGARVHLETMDGTALADVTTDAAGRFAIAAQAAGQYRLRIGDALGSLVLKDGASARELVIALAKDIALAVKPAAGGPDAAAAGEIGEAAGTVSILGIQTSVGTAVAIGIGVGAVAIGGGVTAAVVARDDDGAPPSPSK